MPDEHKNLDRITTPGEIQRNKDLSATDKDVLSTILFWDNPVKGCFARNERIAEETGCNATTVSKSISKLARLGYITIEDGKGSHRSIKIADKYKHLKRETSDRKGKENETPASYDVSAALENARKLDPTQTKRKR